MLIDSTTCLRARCRAHGFTLVELMVTIAVAAVLAAIAVPNFRQVMVSTNLADINNDLAGDLLYARTQAVSRQVDIAVAASAGNWQNGWTVQIPAAGTSATATPTVLRTHPAIPAQYVVSVLPAAASTVTYQAQGSVSATVNSCFTISSAGIQQARFLQVLPAGMLVQTTSTNAPTGSNCPKPL